MISMWDYCDIDSNSFYLFYLPGYRSASWSRFCTFVDLAYEFIEIMDLAFLGFGFVIYPLLRYESSGV
jgi:hypothetical protein